MLKLLSEHMPEGFHWTHPEGGLFLMVKGPEHINTTELLKLAITEEMVAYVAGSSFFCDGSGKNTMRLNFSYETLTKNEEGITRLGRFLKKHV